MGYRTVSCRRPFPRQGVRTLRSGVTGAVMLCCVLRAVLQAERSATRHRAVSDLASSPSPLRAATAGPMPLGATTPSHLQRRMAALGLGAGSGQGASPAPAFLPSLSLPPSLLSPWPAPKKIQTINTPKAWIQGKRPNKATPTYVCFTHKPVRRLGSGTAPMGAMAWPKPTGVSTTTVNHMPFLTVLLLRMSYLADGGGGPGPLSMDRADSSGAATPEPGATPSSSSGGSRPPGPGAAGGLPRAAPPSASPGSGDDAMLGTRGSGANGGGASLLMATGGSGGGSLVSPSARVVSIATSRLKPVRPGRRGDGDGGSVRGTPGGCWGQLP